MYSVLFLSLFLSSVSYAQQSGGGAGYDTIYNPSKSSTYEKHLKEYFYYQTVTDDYLGGSGLSGYKCKDIVGIGKYATAIDFLCIVGGEDGMPFDGIMGMGPDSESLNKIVPSKKFGIFLNANGGEVQLGGYFTESIYKNQTVPFFPSALGKNYGYHITVEYIRISNSAYSEILYSMPTDSDNVIVNVPYKMETIVDSGTDKIMLPTLVSAASDGQILTISLYENVIQWMHAHPTQYQEFFLYITVGGVEYETIIDSGTVGGLRNDFASTFIVGQPFFNLNFVAHDVSDSNSPKIGFARKNLAYIPNTILSYNGITTMPLNYTTDNEGIFFLTIEIGTPATPIRVLLDTGSRDLIVGSTKHYSLPLWFYIAVGGVCLAIVVLAIVCMCKMKNSTRGSKIATEQKQPLLRDNSAIN